MIMNILMLSLISVLCSFIHMVETVHTTPFDTGELGYDLLNGTRKIGPSYAKSVVYM